MRQCRDREELAFVADQSHGVLMERTGASGMTDNQILKFDMRITRGIGKDKLTLSAYLDHVLTQHFLQCVDVIKKLYDKNYEDVF